MLKLNKAPLQIKIQLKLYNQNFNLLNHVLPYFTHKKDGRTDRNKINLKPASTKIVNSSLYLQWLRLWLRVTQKGL